MVPVRRFAGEEQPASDRLGQHVDIGGCAADRDV